MDKNVFDVIIVGGGPGGSTTAALLSKYGRKVLLLEKARFPRDKTCGDAISGKSVAVLKELGLTNEVEKSPHAIVTGVTFSSPNGTLAEIPFHVQEGYRASGYVCRREVYDNILFQNAKKQPNVTTIEQFQVDELVMDGARVAGVAGTNLATKEKQEFRASVVVGADGATSVVARKLGLNELIPKHHCTALRMYYKGVKGMTNNIEIHFVPELMPGYFWIFPLENGLANVGSGMLTSDMAKRKVNLKEITYKAIRENKMFKDRFADAVEVSPVKGWTLPFGSTHRKNHGDGFVLVGDAASLIDPFSGEGIGNAMTSGSFAAKAIDASLKAGDTSEAFFKKNYDEPLWSTIGNELKSSYNMQRLGKKEFLLNYVVKKAATSEQAREMISSTLANPDARNEYQSPLFYLKLLFS